VTNYGSTQTKHANSVATTDPHPARQRDPEGIPVVIYCRSGIVDTTEPGNSQHNPAAVIYRERGYAQFDCVGTYLWIWERLALTEGRTDVVARHIDRNRQTR
jgi:hypothetical protein